MVSLLKGARLALVATEQREKHVWEGRTGWLADVDGEDRLLVDFEGNPEGIQVARKAVPLPPEMTRRSVECRLPTSLLFENGDVHHSSIVALRLCKKIN